jgi:hypothetical protein
LFSFLDQEAFADQALIQVQLQGKFRKCRHPGKLCCLIFSVVQVIVESEVIYDGSTHEHFEASNRTLRIHVPRAKIKGRHDKTIKENSSARK